MKTDTQVDIDQAVALADIISRSVQRFAQLSAVSSAAAPSNVPGVVDVDATAADYEDSGGIADAIRHIVAAAAQLSAVVRPPAEVVMEYATAYHVSAALRLVTEASVPEAVSKLVCLRVHPPHVREIASLCGIDADKLSRVLRLLATHDIFREVTPDAFVHTRLSASLDSGADPGKIVAGPAACAGAHDHVDIFNGADDHENDCMSASDAISTRFACWQRKYGAPTEGAALAALVGIITDESMLHATALTEALFYAPQQLRYLQQRWDGEYAANADPDSPHAAPFSYARPDAHAARQTMFDWLSASESGRAHRLMRFNEAMRGMSALEPGSVLRGFDWTSLPLGSVVVDVGGGFGSAVLPLVRAYPHLHVVVQDRAEVLERAPEFWRANCPEALAEGRVSFEPQDFFEPQVQKYERPVAVFLLRMILHNWPDAQALAILRRLRAAASNDSHSPRTHLLIVDCVLMHACRDDGLSSVGADAELQMQMPQAPTPLLANWGVANALAYKFDLLMLANHNARERTHAQLSALLERAGWRVSSGRPIYAPRGSWLAAVVAEPAPLLLQTPVRSSSYLALRPSQAEEEIQEIDVSQSEMSRDGLDEADVEAERSPTLIGSPTQRAGRWPWPLKAKNNFSTGVGSVDIDAPSKGKHVQCRTGRNEAENAWRVADNGGGIDDGILDDDENASSGKRKSKKELGKRRSFWLALTGAGRAALLRGRTSEPEIGRTGSGFAS